MRTTLSAGELAVWIERFLAHLRHERRLSERTCTGYKRDLALLHSAYHASACATLEADFIRLLIAQQHRRGLGRRSLQRMLAALRTFCDYLMREALLHANPARGVRAPRSPRRLPTHYDVDQVQQLLQSPADAGVLQQRDYAILELFYSSGLRLSELVDLNCAALDLAEGLVRVTGKGGKTRIVPVGRYACAALARWLQTRLQVAPPTEPALFVGRRGCRLTPRAVQKRLKQWAIQCGIDGLHPHRLRHACASHVLESSGNLRAVQELLGHADLSTTQIYTHLDFQHLAQVYDQAHPRARRKTQR